MIYDPTPVTVLNTAVNGTQGGGPQRSMVGSLVVTFSEAVYIEPYVTAFEVKKASGDVVALTVSPPTGFGTVFTLTFSGSQTENGSLKDGEYQLTIFGQWVHDYDTRSMLDGDNNGSFGGNYAFGAQRVDNFFRLYGDSDGDRDVDNLDYARFRTTFNKTPADTGFLWYFDSDGDKDVDTTDFNVFRVQMGKKT